MMELARKSISQRPSAQTTPSGSRRTSLDSSLNNSPHSVSSAGKDEGSVTRDDAAEEVLQAVTLLNKLDLALDPLPPHLVAQPVPSAQPIPPPPSLAMTALRNAGLSHSPANSTPRDRNLTVQTTSLAHHSPSPSQISQTSTPGVIALAMLSRDRDREKGPIQESLPAATTSSTVTVRPTALHRLSRTTSAAKLNQLGESGPNSAPSILPPASDAETQFLLDLRRFHDELQARVDTAPQAALKASDRAKDAAESYERARGQGEVDVAPDAGAADDSSNFCVWPAASSHRSAAESVLALVNECLACPPPELRAKTSEIIDRAEALRRTFSDKPRRLMVTQFMFLLTSFKRFQALEEHCSQLSSAGNSASSLTPLSRGPQDDDLPNSGGKRVSSMRSLIERLAASHQGIAGSEPSSAHLDVAATKVAAADSPFLSEREGPFRASPPPMAPSQPSEPAAPSRFAQEAASSASALRPSAELPPPDTPPAVRLSSDRPPHSSAARASPVKASTPSDVLAAKQRRERGGTPPGTSGRVLAPLGEEAEGPLLKFQSASYLQDKVSEESSSAMSPGAPPSREASEVTRKKNFFAVLGEKLKKLFNREPSQGGQASKKRRMSVTFAASGKAKSERHPPTATLPSDSAATLSMSSTPLQYSTPGATPLHFASGRLDGPSHTAPAAPYDPSVSRLSLESSLVSPIRKPPLQYSEFAHVRSSDSQTSSDRLSLDMNRVPVSTLEVLCRICEKKVPATAIQEHTPICAAVEAACGEDSTVGALERLATALEDGRICPMGGLSVTDRVDVKFVIDCCRQAARLNAEEPALPQSSARAEALLAKVDGVNKKLAMRTPVKKMSRFRPAGAEPSSAGRAPLVGASSQTLVPNSDRGLLLLTAVVPKMVELLKVRVQELQPPDLNVKSARASASLTPVSSAPSTARRVTIDDFEILKPISRGAHGRVYLARKKATGDLFAIKVLRKGDLIRKNLLQNVKKERDILSSTNNPFVVRLFYSFTSKNNVYLVMEYLSGGDLFSLLQNMGCFDEDVARMYIAETVLALEYCHLNGIIHRDIKPDNLLINANGHLKITDFGLSTTGVDKKAQEDREIMMKNLTFFRDEDQPSAKLRESRKFGTPDYLAPEILLGNKHGPEVDWWSMGVMLYEMVTGVPPFNAATPGEIFDNILERSIFWPEELSPECRDLIDRLLTLDPKQRLGHHGASEIRRHPFFASVSWEGLLQKRAAFIPATDHEEDTSYFANKPFSQKSVAADLADHYLHSGGAREARPANSTSGNARGSPSSSGPPSEAPSARNSTGVRNQGSVDLPRPRQGSSVVSSHRPSISSQRPSLARVSQSYKRGSPMSVSFQQRSSLSKGVSFANPNVTPPPVLRQGNSPKVTVIGFGSPSNSKPNSLDLGLGPSQTYSVGGSMAGSRRTTGSTPRSGPFPGSGLSAQDVATAYISDFTGDEIRVPQGRTAPGSASTGNLQSRFLGPISVTVPSDGPPGTLSSSGAALPNASAAHALGAFTAPSHVGFDRIEEGGAFAHPRSYQAGGEYDIETPVLSPAMSPTNHWSPQKGLDAIPQRGRPATSTSNPAIASIRPSSSSPAPGPGTQPTSRASSGPRNASPQGTISRSQSSRHNSPRSSSFGVVDSPPLIPSSLPGPSRLAMSSIREVPLPASVLRPQAAEGRGTDAPVPATVFEDDRMEVDEEPPAPLPSSLPSLSPSKSLVHVILSPGKASAEIERLELEDPTPSEGTVPLTVTASNATAAPLSDAEMAEDAPPAPGAEGEEPDGMAMTDEPGVYYVEGQGYFDSEGNFLGDSIGERSEGSIVASDFDGTEGGSRKSADSRGAEDDPSLDPEVREMARRTFANFDFKNFDHLVARTLETAGRGPGSGDAGSPALASIDEGPPGQGSSPSTEGGVPRASYEAGSP